MSDRRIVAKVMLFADGASRKNQNMGNQRPLFVVAILLAVTFSILNDAHARANETDLQGIDDQSIFSPTFLAELGAADRAGPPKLEAIYRKFVSPAEQAEIELTIAQIYSQRTGMVDPAKAVEWYNKALVRGLPLTALAKHLILRGNMHERLGHDEKALADYVRGLLICLQFNLPDSWPDQNGTGIFNRRRSIILPMRVPRTSDLRSGSRPPIIGALRSDPPRTKPIGTAVLLC